MALKIDDILNQSLQEIGALGQGEVATAQDQAYALVKANMILDQWMAREIYFWADTFTLYTLTAGHAPHLIGPGLTAPDFAIGQRPIRIDAWTLVLNNSNPVVDLPRNTRDAFWWNNQRVKSLQTNIPTDLYYEPDFPNGQLNFWPVPNTNFQVRLKTWALISQFVLGNTFALPPGYQRAIMLTLAKDLCGPFNRTWKPEQESGRAEAIKAIQGNNAQPPRTTTSSSGMKSNHGGRRADFNWRDGSVT